MEGSKKRSQTQKIAAKFLSMYIGFMAWWTLCWEGLQLYIPKSPFYQCALYDTKLANKWIGVSVEITSVGTPISAAGLKNTSKTYKIWNTLS